MTDTISVREAIAARGAEITLVTGQTVRLRYSMLSLEKLEQDFGDITDVVSVVEIAAAALKASDARRKGEQLTEADEKLLEQHGAGAIFTVLARVMLPGLIDVAGVDPREPDSAPVWLEDHPDIAKRLLDPARLGEYMRAFRTAISEAFSAGETPAGDAVPPAPADVSASASPGPSGITTRAPSHIAPTNSSGA